MTNEIPSEVFIGADAGFGDTKAIMKSPEPDQPDTELVFPSTYGYARELGWDRDRIFANYPGDRIVDEQGSWFIGNLARAQLTAAEQFDLQGRSSADAERLRFIKVAIGKLLSGCKDGEAIHIRLATGLPVSHMGDAGVLKELLMGQHVIETDTANFVANIVDVAVMPQPYGTMYANTLTTDGQHNLEALKHKVVAVADMGRHTFDCALDANGEYVDAESDSVESGVHLAHTAIASLLEREYSQKPKPREVFETLRTGYYVAYGEKVDYRKQVNEALEPVRISALNLMRRLWKRGNHIYVIYLSGGGAPLIADVVKAEYKHAVLVPNSQFANARGYLNYGFWKYQQILEQLKKDFQG